VLPFRPTLFAAFFADGLRDEPAGPARQRGLPAPEGQAAEFYGWWGATAFGPSLLSVLSVPRQGRSP
jgi:hypothetical protein